MKKFLFIIQGEGRGHLTQAIALAEILKDEGHEIVAMMIGVKDKNKIPAFFKERIESKIIAFESPSLVYHPQKKSLSISRTLLQGFLKFPIYLKSIREINQNIILHQPDIIINFYDILGGFSQFLNTNLWFSSKPMICIAHQYLLLHKDFVFPENHSLIDKFLINLNTKLTSLGAKKRLALSFRKMENDLGQNIVVVPPLLRKEIFDLKKENSATENFILVYMTQSSMERELINWHQENKHLEIHCFSDRQQIPDVLRHSKNLFFHKINGTKFLEMMKRCKAVVSTAGFESVCEAMFLQKPTMMIPLPKHFEQCCNAVDAQLAGAGIIGSKFNLNPIINYLEKQKVANDAESWFLESKTLFISQILDNQSVEYKISPTSYEASESYAMPI